MALQFGEEQFSQPSTHLLISVYIVCQQLWKVPNLLIGYKYHQQMFEIATAAAKGSEHPHRCKYCQQMLEIDLEISIAQLS